MLKKYEDVKIENYGIVSTKEMTVQELQKKISENLFSIQKVLGDLTSRVTKLEKIEYDKNHVYQDDLPLF